MAGIVVFQREDANQDRPFIGLDYHKTMHNSPGRNGLKTTVSCPRIVAKVGEVFIDSPFIGFVQNVKVNKAGQAYPMERCRIKKEQETRFYHLDAPITVLCSAFA